MLTESMRTIVILLMLIISSTRLSGQEMEKEEVEKTVKEFIKYVKNGQRDKIAAPISYPFERNYPIPDIKSKQEFMSRYKEVFDDSLEKLIIKSSPSKDWGGVGWRGIMLFNGTLWLDYDGRLMAVNYQSNVERRRWEDLVQDEKRTLHESVKNYVRPIHILETKKYRIRIDDMAEGNFRYSSWPITSKMSDKPDIVLQSGEVVSEGSGGNHYYEFKNGDYTYQCSIILMGEDTSPPALLTVYKNDKEILRHQAKIVRH